MKHTTDNNNKEESRQVIHVLYQDIKDTLGDNAIRTLITPTTTEAKMEIITTTIIIVTVATITETIM